MMNAAAAYYSALHDPPPEPPAPPVERFEVHGSLAFVHDVWHDLPAEYAGCDVFCSDPPWPRGYDTFNARAGVTGAPPFDRFARRLDELARGLGAPVVYVVGASFLRLFRPDCTARLALNGRPAVAACYRVGLPAALPDSEALLSLLARRFSRIGDHMAGYGRSGRVFARAGKSFVLSDYNPRCIGYIARHAMEWFP